MYITSKFAGESPIPACQATIGDPMRQPQLITFMQFLVFIQWMNAVMNLEEDTGK